MNMTAPTPPTALTLTAQDHDAVQALLARAGLPYADLTPTYMALFLGLRASDTAGASKLLPGERPAPWIAIAGLEPHHGDGLLRSLLVLPEHRGQGLARALVHAQEARARGLGLRRLVLLTETAADFFRALGYRDTDRATLPDGLRAAPQFAQLCPASASCLSKPL
ncbi:GNAT family N-acetyltransferase [Leptospira sp. 96542]|nr:GNAT family N-acetyltransferase [Leptospira sp. 96542]